MSQVLAATDSVTAEWLTDVLRAAGALPRGAVTAVAERANAAFNSSATHLTLTYSREAPANAPRHLFLKRNIDTAWARASGANEVAFYRVAAPHLAHLPMVVPCYAADYDEPSGNSCCLLLDVSVTHAAPVTRDELIAGQGVPPPVPLAQAVDALAAFHAYWWEHPLLGRIPAAEVTPWYRDAAHYTAHVERRRREWAAFIAAEGAWFPADLRALFEGVVARMPLLWDRFIGPRVTALRGMTLCHGDCYLTQFLCPRDNGDGPAYLVDWQDTGADFNGFDLVHMFGFWTLEQRQEGGREERLLRRYHAGLLARGVQGYTWEDLLDDYRLMLIILLLYPVWDQTNGSARSYWWPKLERFSAAYRAHDCGALLDL
jgi:hypothetical protein